MRPSVSYGYNPSLKNYYDTYALDAAELRQSNIPAWGFMDSQV
jgi:hypothetical protein